MAKETEKPKALSKSDILSQLAEATDLTKKDVQKVFDALAHMIEKQIGKKGPGVFTIPGLLRLKVTRKPATKDREGINPFTKQPTIFKGKPARNVVRAVPLKALKDMA